MTRHLERHRTKRTGWLRSAVLGANDGIVSTASLVLGFAATHATHSKVLVTGITGLVAGAMAMAAGEYVSVQSQADTETADVELERRTSYKKPRSTMNMRPAITKKRPSTMPAGAMKRPGIMPTSPTVTTCMLLTMRKKPQSITSKSTL